MDRITIREARLEDVYAIAGDLREADVFECFALGVHPVQALVDGVKQSTRAWTGEVDGVPSAMFGVAPISALTGRGAPWMLTTNRIEASPLEFLSKSRARVAEMLRSYPHLLNYSWVGNEKANRWLKWLGFTFGEPEAKGQNGELFCRFEMRLN